MSHPQPERTQNSLIFGTPAKDVTSTLPRFIYSKQQENAIIDHVTSHLDTEFKFDNLDLLLEKLDLHGYEDVRNSRFENLNDLIVKKIKSKIALMRQNMGLGNLPID
ncbi:hypothetical protein F5X98DRAFT_371141 [Xylaria grammica]|nr:hypothetical protein F5X98DRAFT_371141 [Xylaria grammica]